MGSSAAAAPRPPGPAFLRTPIRLQAWVSGTVAAAVVLPFALHHVARSHTAHGEVLTGVLLVGLSTLNVEIGRMLEGGVSDSQRPHKGLSAWAFAAALLLPSWWLLPVVATTYAHAWWRGLRVPPWKWVGSAAYVVLAGLAASTTASSLLGDETDLMLGDGRRGVAAVVVAALAFLAVETLLFHGSAFLNTADDEAWLRATLRSPSFYLTEAAVLLVGGLSAGIWTGGGWFVLLLAPVYGVTQRAALHEPLRERAEHDGKTGALRFESWRRLAFAGVERCHRQQRPWCVMFADLDRFKLFNDSWGHLVGDAALVVVADAIRSQLRRGDLLGRFGGEEFCVFLPELDPAAGALVAERVREAVGSAGVPGAAQVTISVGLAAADASVEPDELVAALAAADRALFRAKDDGRDLVRTELVSG